MSAPKTIKIDDVEYVRRDAVEAAPEMDNNNAVIIRADRAGVFFGYLHKTDLSNGVVELKQARRIWYWSGAATLSQMAVDGVSKPNDCKFPVAVPHISIAGVIEVIPCSKKAVASINSVPTWKQ